VILSRTFHGADGSSTFEQAVAELRQAERELASRDAAAVEADRIRVAAIVRQLAAGAAPR
jgi:hypothetical protein